MSSDQYPEVRSEEPGLVPQQPKAEWPKKIRTLTAAELDRLTIDSEGRFLWDGRPVNYVAPDAPPPATPAPPPSADALDRSAMEMLDRAALELSERRPLEAATAPPPPAEPAEAPAQVYNPVEEVTAPAATEIQPIGNVRADEEIRPGYDVQTVDPYGQYATVAPPTMADNQYVYAQPVFADKVRVSLSFWQSLGAILLVLSLLIAAAGVAASGFAEAHNWSCRIGLTSKYCPAPPPPPPAPPPRADIPA